MTEIKTNQSQLLAKMASAQNIRNRNCNALIERAMQMSYCKRNIMLAKIMFWDKIYTEVVDLLINREPRPKHHSWNANSECLSYIKNNDLANPFFAEFFFNFHEPLTLAFLRRLKRELGNGLPLEKKFTMLAEDLTELLNLARIELDGLDISCESFGGSPICPNYKTCRQKDCTDPAGVFFVMMNEEYKMEIGLFEEILEVAMKYLERAKDPVIMIVDYTNMMQTDYEFGPRARARYDYCMKYIKQVYFYNWKAGLKFGHEFDGLEPFLIPDKAWLKKVINTWKIKRELVLF